MNKDNPSMTLDLMDMSSYVGYVPADYTDPAHYLKYVKDMFMANSKEVDPKQLMLDMMRFITFCKRKRLDPLLKECYAVYRKDKKSPMIQIEIGGKIKSVHQKNMVIIVGIDGLRRLASDTGLYGGQGVIVYEWLDDGRATSATATVYRINPISGQVIETQFTTFADEFPAGMSPIASRMPKHMLGIRAEAHALRKAFPEIGQVYTPEEFGLDEKKLKSETAEAKTDKALADADKTELEMAEEALKGMKSKKEFDGQLAKMSKKTQKLLLEKGVKYDN